MERGARTSGSRFAYLKGDLVFLQFALVQFALQKLAGKGFRPVIVPVLVRDEAMYGTGFFPTDMQQVYRVEADGLNLVGTSEVPLAALHMDEILDEADLPVRYVGYSSCFRREAGAAGKDTRGIFRVHQFDKVEMFSFCAPDKSAGGARLHALGGGGGPAGTGPPLPGGQHRRRRPGRSGRQEVRPGGVAAHAGALPRGHLLLQLHRLPGAAPEGAGQGRARAGRICCTRSTARWWRWAAR